jgi:acetolactate synthase-1/2/3 large subunit
MHPARALAAVQARLGADAIVVADGGDALSHARVGLAARTWLDPGSLGCLGVGVPFGIAAALASPLALAPGGAAHGLALRLAVELDTAARHGARVLFVVLDNAAWQIEVDDQRASYGRVVGTRLQLADWAAVARGGGVAARRVEAPADLDAALDWAFAHRPALLDVVVTPDAPSPDSRSGLAWVPDLQPLAAWDELERAWRSS